MRANRFEVMKDVVRDLYRAEIAIDEALSALATLSATLPQARLRARVAATMGQAAIDEVLAACSLVGQARGKLVETHRHLDEVRSDLGLPVVAAGGGYEKPLSDNVFTAVTSEDIAA